MPWTPPSHLQHEQSCWTICNHALAKQPCKGWKFQLHALQFVITTGQVVNQAVELEVLQGSLATSSGKVHAKICNRLHNGPLQSCCCAAIKIPMGKADKQWKSATMPD